MMYSQDPIDAAIDALNEYSIAIPICEGYQFNLSDMREAMQAAIAAYLDAMPSPLYHCESVWEAEQRSTAELATLRTRAERAEARIVELEQAAKRQAAAALAGMNATKAVSSWEMQEARRLKAECSPASVASQRDANERLTNELQAAQSTIAELTATVDAIAACLPGYLYMDPPDGGDVPLAEQVRRMSVDAAIGRKSDALRDFAKDFADEPCAYGDGCPPFAGTRHGTCLHCQARAALGDAE